MMTDLFDSVSGQKRRRRRTAPRHAATAEHAGGVAALAVAGRPMPDPQPQASLPVAVVSPSLDGGGIHAEVVAPVSGNGVAPPAQLVSDAKSTTVHQMFRRDLLYVLGGMLPLAISALLLPVIARIMGQRQFGIVSFEIAISAALFVLICLGLQTAVQREYARESGPVNTRSLVSTAMVIVLVLTVTLAATARWWSGPIGASSFSWAMTIASWWSGGAALTLICIGFLRSADRVYAFMIVVFTQSVGSQILGVSLVLLTAHDAHSYLIGLLIGQALATAIALAFVKPTVPSSVQLRSTGQILRFSLPLVPQQLAAFILWSGDRVIVQRDLGSGAQARYAIAYAVGAVTLNVVNQLNQAWMPRIFALHDPTERKHLLQAAQVRLDRLLAFVVLALTLLAPFLLVVAAPQSYSPRSLLFVTALVAPAALLLSGALSNQRALLAQGRSVPLALVAAGCAVCNIVLNILFVPPWGISGSAFATLLTYGVLSWVSTVVVGSDDWGERFRREFRIWAAIGTCLATTLVPWSTVGFAVRGVAFIVVVALTVAMWLRPGAKSAARPA